MAKPAPKAQPIPPIAVLHGPERFLQLAHTQSIRAAIAQQYGDIEPVIFDGASCQPADVLDECRSLGLMQPFKLVIVENADALLKSSDDDDEDAKAATGIFDRARPGGGGHGSRTPREMFQAYADRPEPAACLIMRAPTWRPGKFDKALLMAQGVLIKCDELGHAQAVAWAIKRATEHHAATLEPAAADRLVATVGADLGRIDGEIAKLAMVNPGKPITEPVVAEMTGASREEEFWALQPSILSGDPARALGHLNELLEVSRHDPTPLTFTCMDLARKLHGAARGLREREPRGALMSRLKLWGSSADVILDKASRMNPAAIARVMGRIVDSTVRVRTGQGDAVRQLEAVTLEFASLCRV